MTRQAQSAVFAKPSHVVPDRTLRQMLGYNVKRACLVIQCDLAQLLEPFGLRLVTYSVLVLIVDNPDIRQSQLAEALAIVQPNLVVVVDELERCKLVARHAAPGDRRARALRATAAGRRLCEKATRAMRRREVDFAGCVGDSDGLVNALNKIENAIAGGL